MNRLQRQLHHLGSSFKHFIAKRREDFIRRLKYFTAKRREGIAKRRKDYTRRLKYFIAKRREDFALHLKWAPDLLALIAIVLSFIFAPIVDCKHPPDRLNDFLLTMASLLAVVGVVLFFIQRTDNERALRFLSVRTVVYFIVAILAALAGLLPLPDDAYRFIFAIVVAFGLAAIVTFGLVGGTYISEQRKAAQEAKLRDYRKRQEDSTTTSED
jgi:hypothetical protein